MFMFLGFVVPWAWLLLSCTVYMCVFFSPEVRTLLLRVAQSNELSIGRGDLQFMFREWVQSQQGVVFLEGMSGLQWSEYMDDIPLAGLVRTSRDPACFALCFYLHGCMKSRSTCSRHLHWDGLSEEFIRTVTQEKKWDWDISLHLFFAVPLSVKHFKVHTPNVYTHIYTL